METEELLVLLRAGNYNRAGLHDVESVDAVVTQLEGALDDVSSFMRSLTYVPSSQYHGGETLGIFSRLSEFRKRDGKWKTYSFTTLMGDPGMNIHKKDYEFQQNNARAIAGMYDLAQKVSPLLFTRGLHEPMVYGGGPTSVLEVTSTMLTDKFATVAEHDKRLARDVASLIGRIAVFAPKSGLASAVPNIALRLIDIGDDVCEAGIQGVHIIAHGGRKEYIAAGLDLMDSLDRDSILEFQNRLRGYTWERRSRRRHDYGKVKQAVRDYARKHLNCEIHIPQRR